MPWSAMVSVLWSVLPPYSRWILWTGMSYTSVQLVSVKWIGIVNDQGEILEIIVLTLPITLEASSRMGKYPKLLRGQ